MVTKLSNNLNTVILCPLETPPLPSWSTNILNTITFLNGIACNMWIAFTNIGKQEVTGKSTCIAFHKLTLQRERQFVPNVLITFG